MMGSKQMTDDASVVKNNSSRMAMVISFMLLGLISAFDFYILGWDVYFSILYLVPVGISAWFCGRLTCAVMCICAAGVSFGIDLSEQTPLREAMWSAAAHLGTMLGLFVVLSTIHTHLRKSRSLFSLHGTGAVAGILACCLWAMVSYGSRYTQSHEKSGNYSDPATVLSQLGADTEACLRLSRPVLLGSRNPKGVSCVRVVKTGEVSNEALSNMADFDGGPGTRMAALYGIDRGQCKNPKEDYLWHQSRLKALLENMVAANEEPKRVAIELSRHAMELQQRVSAMKTWPSQFMACGFSARGNWPGYCLSSLNEAVRARDLAGAKRWSTEFAAAALELADLHRWVDLLARNHLAALEYQEKCQSLFGSVDVAPGAYESTVTIGQFPAGLLGLHGMQNYFEVERQAERLYSILQERQDSLARMPVVPEEAIWVPPTWRDCYLELREALSEENRKTWDLAARTPYEHSYMVNMLFRTSRCGAVKELAVALRRLSNFKPNASMQDLMDVLMYRNHSFAGLEWSDSYLPQIMTAAGGIGGSDLDAFIAAHRMTFDMYRESTYGSTYTLREAIAQRKFDCNRLTDMIGALCRNSGHSGLGHVRWCAGTDGHSQAAIVSNDPSPKVLIMDGMLPMTQPQVWPNAFFKGHPVHPNQGNISDPYAVELYVRGIDSYIWAGGYIIRGENAGMQIKAAIPYLSGWEKPSCEKIYNGPYPAMKTAVGGVSYITLPALGATVR